MSAQRTSFEKLQRDRAKKAKAAAKRERRQERDASAPPTGPRTEIVLDDDRESTNVVTVSDFGPELSAADLLQLVESLHRQFDEGTISYETFEEQKAELFGRLPID